MKTLIKIMSYLCYKIHLNLQNNKIDNFKGNIDDELYNEFFQFYINNFSSYKEMEDYFCKQNLDLIEKLFKDIELNGVKCRIWTWQNEYVPFLKNNSWYV